jgi:hypothetical protein
MQRSAVRHRPPASQSSGKPVGKEVSDLHPSYTSRSLKDRPASRSPVLSGSVWLLLFSYYGVLLLYIHATTFSYPEVVTTANSRQGQFVEERARKHLDDLTQFGSRPVSSIANEKLTVEYLLNEIEAIRLDMETSVHRLEVDTQRVSGTFTIDFLGQFTSYYENVNNIVVRLSPQRGANHSLLVNCHYDTSMNTTGKYLCLSFNEVLNNQVVKTSYPALLKLYDGCKLIS